MKFNLKFFAVYVASLFLIFSCANSDKRNLASVPSDPVPSYPVPSDPVPTTPVLLGPVATFPKGVAANMFFDGKGELQERTLDKTVFYISYEIFKKEDDLCIIELTKCNRAEGSAANCDGANEHFAKHLDLISFVKVPESDYWFLLNRTTSVRNQVGVDGQQQAQIDFDVTLFNLLDAPENNEKIKEAIEKSKGRAFLWLDGKKRAYLNENATELPALLQASLEELMLSPTPAASEAATLTVSTELSRLSDKFIDLRDNHPGKTEDIKAARAAYVEFGMLRNVILAGEIK